MKLSSVGAVALVTVLVSTLHVGAQQAPVAPAFEIASIKPNKTGERGGGSQTFPGGRYTATNIHIRGLIQSAYGLRHSALLIGGPSWLGSDRFDINAKAAGNPSLEDFRAQVQFMVRTLLAERFKLKVHNEMRQLPMYALVLTRQDGKLGPRLRPTTLADCQSVPAAPTSDTNMVIPCGGGALRLSGHYAARALAFSQLSATIGSAADRPVEDRTGLDGTFDWDLQWTPEELGRPESGDAISLFTALQEQLGLKLEPTRGPVDVLVIESVERPSED